MDKIAVRVAIILLGILGGGLLITVAARIALLLTIVRLLS